MWLPAWLVGFEQSWVFWLFAQLLVSVTLSGHGLPPCSSACFTRVRKIWPWPQLVEHSLQVSHSPKVQSTGHGFLLHVSLKVKLPAHGIPPLAARILLSRLLFAMPPLHVAVQRPQSFQSAHTQSTGHASPPQGADCVSFPVQGSPPCSRFVSTDRVRFMMPPLQDLEHTLHSAHADHPQSTGHPSLLQVHSSTAAPGHGFPPYSSLTILARLRFISPAPQVEEHKVQADQLPQTQS